MKGLRLTIIALNDQMQEWARPYVTHWIVAEKGEPEDSIIQKVRMWMKDNPTCGIDGAITFWEEEIPLLARICKAFGFIGNSVQASLNTRSKFIMQDVLRQQGRPSIRQHFIRSYNDLEKAIEKVGFPAVVKPVFGSDSMSVVYVTNPEEARKGYQHVLNSFDHPYEVLYAYERGLFVYQEFIDGIEFSIECFCQHGTPHIIGIHEKTAMHLPFFMETGDYIPPRISEADRCLLIEETAASLRALGVTDSLAHVEIKLGQSGPQVIEIASRMGGDYTYGNVLQVYGFDLVKAGCEIALGTEVADSSPVPKSSVISSFFIPEKSGVLRKFTGLDTLSTDKNVVAYSISKKIGETVLVPPEGFESIGWVCVKGKDVPDAEKKLRYVLKNFSYELVPIA